jgi:YD repeat-containing protein
MVKLAKIVASFVLFGSSCTSNSEVFAFFRDELGRIVRVESSSGLVISYTYDASGNRLSESVSQANRPPVAIAGPDLAVRIGTLVRLSGSASFDPDNGPSPLMYRWTKVSGPSTRLNGADTSTPSFTAQAAGTYTIRLVVNDGVADSAASLVRVLAR